MEGGRDSGIEGQAAALSATGQALSVHICVQVSVRKCRVHRGSLNCERLCLHVYIITLQSSIRCDNVGF